MPDTLAVKVAEWPAHTVAEFTDTIGLGLTVRLPQPLPVQPLASVTVTQYWPATLALKLATLPGLLAPAGTVHAYVVTAAVIPETLAVSVAELPAHTVAEFTDTIGLGLTVRLPQPLPVQPLASVTVTQYWPATLALKLGTLPGLLTPAGTV